MKKLIVLALFSFCLPSISLHAQINVVMNGDFSTGDFTDWTTTNVTDNPDPSQSPYVSGGPDYAAYFPTVGALDYVYQTIATTPGVQYAVSFDLNEPDEGSGFNGAEFFLNIGGTVTGSTQGTSLGGNDDRIWGGNIVVDVIDPDNLTSDYTLFGGDFTATCASTELIFAGRNDPSIFILDHVSVTAVPEPGQWGVLASLGALGLALARRWRQSPQQGSC